MCAIMSVCVCAHVYASGVWEVLYVASLLCAELSQGMYVWCMPYKYLVYKTECEIGRVAYEIDSQAVHRLLMVYRTVQCIDFKDMAGMSECVPYICVCVYSVEFGSSRGGCVALLGGLKQTLSLCYWLSPRLNYNDLTCVGFRAYCSPAALAHEPKGVCVTRRREHDMHVPTHYVIMGLAAAASCEPAVQVERDYLHSVECGGFLRGGQAEIIEEAANRR